MFEGIKKRLFFAKIQAELKAQYNDQQFVNRVCQLPPTVKLILDSRNKSYFKGTKIEPFLWCLIVLGEASTSNLLSSENRNLSASLLADRLTKSNSNPSFRIEHSDIISQAEAQLSNWKSTIKQTHRANAGGDSDNIDLTRGTGRYELRYKVEMVQKIRGKELISEQVTGVRSDDLDELKSMAFMHNLAGKEVEILDLKNNNFIPID